MGRPKTVYRGKRKYRWIFTVLACVLIALVVGGIWLFTFMQQYIVYDKDGLSLVLPFMREEESAPGEEGEETVPFVPLESVEIVVEEPDLSGVNLVGDGEIPSLHARYVSAESMSAENLNYFAFELSGKGQDAMVLQLKTAGGYLSYRSQVELATSYGVNGTEDIRSTVAALKEQGVYLVAEISCLLDDAMAQRNSPLALKNSAGDVFTDASGSWLDPYNKTVRGYLTALMAEAADMGFDEVLLTGVAHTTVQNVSFSQSMTVTPSLSGGVATFALRMSEEARELGLKCSVLCDTARLRAGTSGDIGQDLELFFRLFDRVYVKTDMDYLSVDVAALENALGGEGGARIVPIVSGYTPTTDSWAVQ